MSVDDKIKIIGENIDSNIDCLNKSRALLSQNILGQLRNLIEAIAVKVYGHDKGITDINITYQTIVSAMDYIKSKGKYKLLAKFHNFLQHSTSHYTEEPNNAERLMLKYYLYLIKIRSFLKKEFMIEVLHKLDDFPVNLDKNIYEYYAQIANKIENSLNQEELLSFNSRYYVRKIRPFFIQDKIFYEVTFTDVNDKSNKFDRIIAYTKHEILENYAIKIKVKRSSIVLNKFIIPTHFIEDWEVSIRPCEFDNLGNIFNEDLKVKSGARDYQSLMKYLTDNCFSLNDFLELDNERYQHEKQIIFSDSSTKLVLFLNKIREFLMKKKKGSNVIKYLLYIMRNDVIKNQSRWGKLLEPNDYLSTLRLNNKCIPFEEMPFSSALVNHNPNLGAIFECISSENREDELLARMVKNKTERSGKLYIKLDDIPFVNIDELINKYNSKLYKKHENRCLSVYKNHIYIKGYDDDVKYIICKILEKSKSGVLNYSNTVKKWLNENESINDSPEKEQALIRMFESSKVAAVYGSAGVGKTTLINLIAGFFSTQKKLFLANTHPAIDNLKRRVKTTNCDFMTIAKYQYHDDTDYDLIFIDESSTVSNTDMSMILEKSSYQLLILVGDIYQIQSITFGNWFDLIKKFLPNTSVIELENPYRTHNENLLDLWKKVREIDPTITETLVRNEYVSDLNTTIFEKSYENEIILCLNYDGLYGINNINRILQINNSSEAISWGVNTYKVNDPILFNESSDRFGPLLYNNLKGTIKNIIKAEENLVFDIALDKPINELDLVDGVKLVGEDEMKNSIIRFSVNRSRNSDNEDNDNLDDVVPFNISYATSIHKSQGLEFDSVKIVVSNEVDELITHNIFYTAITRAKKKLKIYWSPETQNSVIEKFERVGSSEDIYLLSNKHDLEIQRK